MFAVWYTEELVLHHGKRSLLCVQCVFWVQSRYREKSPPFVSTFDPHLTDCFWWLVARERGRRC